VPELPEVETVVRELRPRLLGRRIASVTVGNRPLRRRWSAEWDAHLVGRQVRTIQRRGKWILMALVHDPKGDCSALGGMLSRPLAGVVEGYPPEWPRKHGTRRGSTSRSFESVLAAELYLVIHLGMTGQLTVASTKTPPAEHTHLVLGLAGKRQQLRFRDIRRFGSATVFASSNQLDLFFQEIGLGPEPFDLEPKYWHDRLAATGRCLKAVLLDQRVVAGVGNIYADEALFEARLSPAQLGRDTIPRQAERLRRAIVTVLQRAIERRGSSIRNYVGGSGLKGKYQEEFRVYGRTGHPCPRCRSPIACLRLAGRSTHFCPRCQGVVSGEW
jgi:formamidopyrimidine-DNA glycosylase